MYVLSVHIEKSQIVEGAEEYAVTKMFLRVYNGFTTMIHQFVCLVCPW